MKARVEKSAPIFAMGNGEQHWELTNMDLRAGTEIDVVEVDNGLVMYPDGTKCGMRVAQFKLHGNWYGCVVDETIKFIPSQAAEAAQ